MNAGSDKTDTSGNIDTIPKVSIAPKTIINKSKTNACFLSLTKSKSQSFLYVLSILFQILVHLI